MTETRYLTVPQLAKRLAVTTGTVYGWNKTRRGPKYHKFGNHVRYKLADVESWERAHLVTN
jgi:excisionase family DNA binding protein